MNRIPCFGVFIALASFTVLGAPAARATLLVYEGFTGYTAGTLANQKPNDNTVGLDKNVGYYDGAVTSRAGGYTLTTGLSLGSLQVSGGALAYTSNTNVIGADITLASAHTGTLWSSYLTRITTRGGSIGDGSLLRVGDSPSDTLDIRYTTWADSRTSSANVAVSYASASGIDSNNALEFNTTYIIIGRFTGVGTSAGVGTVWALNAEQFIAFLAADDPESALAVPGSVTATASHNNPSGARNFITGDAFSLVTVNGTGVFDEIRFGDTLASVTPSTVPEPAAASILAGLAATLAISFRRRRD